MTNEGTGVHQYAVRIDWCGNTGQGTASYSSYARDFSIEAPRKAAIDGSADAAFRGDPNRWNPEELLVASVSACHQLWYLHLCADAGIRVIAYRDAAEGAMRVQAGGAGCFTGVILRPVIELAAESDAKLAATLHERAHELCFIANSVTFPIRVEAEIHVSSNA
jgi:organic hydroperoxide reductase OsmC/OhrA